MKISHQLSENEKQLDKAFCLLSKGRYNECLQGTLKDEPVGGAQREVRTSGKVPCFGDGEGEQA